MSTATDFLTKHHQQSRRLTFQLLQPLRAGVQSIKRGGGFVLIVVGIWLMILAIWADTFAQLFAV